MSAFVAGFENKIQDLSAALIPRILELAKRKQKNTTISLSIYFDQFNALLLKKSIHSFMYISGTDTGIMLKTNRMNYNKFWTFASLSISSQICF